MKSVKLFLLTMLIVCFANAEAQYKYTSPATVTIELTLVETNVFKKITETDINAMKKNKVKQIHFKNSRGDVNYHYNENGFITDFSISDADGNSSFNQYEYDAKGQLIKYFYGSKSGKITDGVTYNYKYDDNGNIKSAWTEPNVMFSPAKQYVINYSNKDFPNTPTSIDYYKGENDIEPPLYSATIQSDDKGRINFIMDKNGKTTINVNYIGENVDLDYLGDFVTHYTIKDNRFVTIADDFVTTNFTYKDNGLIDYFTITSKEDNKEKKFVMEYEYYK